MKSVKKYALYFALLANLGIIIGFWWSGSHELFGNNASDMTLAFGRLTGLLAVYFILLQFLFMGRTMWIEKVFGLDKIARIHHLNGYLSISFILIHPVLLLISYAITDKMGLVEQFMDFIKNYADVWLSAIAVILFTLVVFLSISVARKRLKYETWYFVHLITYLAVLLAFGHQLKVGGDLLGSKPFAYYWWMIYIFVFGNVLLFRFIRPIFNTLKFKFTVDDVVAETNDTTSVYITGKNLQNFRIQPGQFMIVRFLAKGFWWQAHPFSLSFAPKNNQLRITIKNLGDFTSKIPTIQKGTPMYIDGPYGVFTAKPEQNTKYLFIAGGVGITAIRCLIEKVSATNDTILLYNSKVPSNIIFKEELDKLTLAGLLTTHHILSDQAEYAGEKGRIDKDKLQRLVKDIREREVYVCGPAPMMDAMIKLLQDKDIGVSRKNIHFEKFAL